MFMPPHLNKYELEINKVCTVKMVTIKFNLELNSSPSKHLIKVAVLQKKNWF